MKAQKQFVVQLSEPEMAGVLNLIKQAPMNQVEGLVRKIEDQLRPQLADKPPEKEEKPAREEPGQTLS